MINRTYSAEYIEAVCEAVREEARERAEHLDYLRSLVESAS